MFVARMVTKGSTSWREEFEQREHAEEAARNFAAQFSGVLIPDDDAPLYRAVGRQVVIEVVEE